MFVQLFAWKLKTCMGRNDPYSLLIIRAVTN